jgi:hypothetical protein
MKKEVLGLALAVTLFGAAVSAHHGEAVALGSVRFTQPVMVGGTMLQPGTYELRDNGMHGTPLPGQAADAQAQIEFLQNGMVVARDIAEVMPAAGGRPVGTSGGGGRAVVQRLRGDEFLRISAQAGNERYLIHLPIGN